MSDTVLSLWRGDVLVSVPGMRQMAEEVAARHGIGIRDILSDSRLRYCVWPRQEAMALMYQTGRWSLTQIGRFFGRDHTTVLHAVRAHNKRAKATRAAA